MHSPMNIRLNEDLLYFSIQIYHPFFSSIFANFVTDDISMWSTITNKF